MCVKGNRVAELSSLSTSSISFSFCSCTSSLTLRCFYLLGWGACLRLCLTRRIYNSIDFQLLFVKYAMAFTLGQLFFAHTVRSFCVCEMCVRWQSLIMKHINWQRLPPAEPGRAETTRNCCSPHKKAVCLAPTTAVSSLSPWYEQATGKVPSKS